MSNTPRESILEEAARLITGDRNKTYGSPTQNFQDTADVWNVLLAEKFKYGEAITPGEVAMMMVGLKLVRSKAQPKEDNWVDIAGYAGCGFEADVETGRIEPDPQKAQTLWGKPGDRLVLATDTPEPVNVRVLYDDTDDGEGLEFAHNVGPNRWVWSSSEHEIGLLAAMEWTWLRMIYAGRNLMVVR